MKTITKSKTLLAVMALTSLSTIGLATGVNSTELGTNNTVSGTSSLATGFTNTVTSNNAFVLGTNNTVQGENALAGGNDSKALGRNSIAFGSHAEATEGYTYAIGSQAKASASNTVAIGNGAYATGANAVAFGPGTTADSKDSIAIGSYVQSNSEHTVAIGSAVTAKSSDSIGIGHGVTNSLNNTVGIGNGVVNNFSNAIGIGNGVATNFNTVGIGNGVSTTVQDSISVGNGVETNGESSVAIGNGIHADGVKTINIGTNVSAKGVSSIVVGRDTVVAGDDTTVVGANNGTVSADQAAVFGYNNKVLDGSKEQLIFGSNSQTKSQGAVVVGSHAQATGIDAFALGNNTIADLQNGVALGSNSVTELQVGTTNIKDNTTDIRFSNSTYAGSNPDSVVSFGTHGRAGAGGVTEYTRQLQNLAAGRVSATSTDGINGSQLYDVALEAQKYNTLVDGTNTTVESKDNAFGRKEYKVNVNKDLKDMNSVEFGTANDSVHSYIGKDKVHFFNGSENTKVDSKGIYIENTDTLDQAQFTTNGMIASDSAGTVRFTTTDISAGGQQIHDVKDGVAGTDAVNVSQLNKLENSITPKIDALNTKANNHEVRITDLEGKTDKVAKQVDKNTNDIQSLDNKIDNVGSNVLGQSKSYTDTQVSKVGANAAALSALHPLDFNPDDKWQFSAGYGNYKGSNAAAVGAFYQPNENVLLSVGTTFGTGDNMINAGATVRFGSHSKMNTNKQVAVAKEVQDLKLQLATISQKYDNLVNALKSSSNVKPEEFTLKDVPQDHWAYEFVHQLVLDGVITGYPDDTFKGDHAISRYELATMLYKAINNGAVINADMIRAIDEFKPELDKVNEVMRYRVDRVHGKDNDKNKVDRVRVNSKRTLDTYRDSYGTQFAK